MNKANESMDRAKIYAKQGNITMALAFAKFGIQCGATIDEEIKKILDSTREYNPRVTVLRVALTN